MMDTKHTPGPLWASRNQGVVLGQENQPYIVSGSTGYTALCSREADAILYAAAPKLLEALRVCVDQLCLEHVDEIPWTEERHQEVYDCSMDECTVCRALAGARNIIAVATQSNEKTATDQTVESSLLAVVRRASEYFQRDSCEHEGTEGAPECLNCALNLAIAKATKE